MSHPHNHTHHHHHEPQSFNYAFAIAVVMNLGFTLFEIVYAFLANSMGLLADAVHNFGDVFGLLLAWGANWLLTLPARKRYSYGFKRTTILASLANAIILTTTSALIAYEALQKLFAMKIVNEHIVIIVALLGIAINGGTALLFRRGAHDDLNIQGAFLHLMGDALIAIGVVFSGLLILLTKHYWIDPLVGLLIVGIILWGTWGLLRDSVRLILDAVPRHIDYQGVEFYLKQLPHVEAVHDLHIWGLSTKEIALTAHLIMPKIPLSDADYRNINKILKEKFRIDHVTLQVETGSDEHPCLRTETC